MLYTPGTTVGGCTYKAKEFLHARGSNPQALDPQTARLPFAPLGHSGDGRRTADGALF